MSVKIDSPSIMTIFGGTGDLAHRKLIPALYNLASENQLPEEFAIVGVGRTEMNHIQYREELKASVEKYSRFKIKPKIWEMFAARVYYFSMDFADGSAYKDLKIYLNNINEAVNARGNILYYLSVAPAFFETIVLNLKAQDMALNKDCWQRIIIEKPFGSNLKTAIYLNHIIEDVFPLENIFRIDHYLGKEMLQNLLVIRFGNAMFENIWNSKYIENIQITSSETVGVEKRAQYYESSGALKDMMQNHMLQLLALVAMEPPASLSANAIRSEKVKFLRSLTPMDHTTISENVIRGQYDTGILSGESVPGYRKEAGVHPDSGNETFVAMKLQADNFRWGGMPFYLRTGKRMKQKTTHIIIEFKSMPQILYFKEYKGMQPNLLEILIQPKEGISFRFNAKKPGNKNEISNVKMEFCQNCTYETNSPESYERLIADALRNDQTLYTSWEEIETTWRFVDNLAEAWKMEDSLCPNYAAGTCGPLDADALLEKGGHHWWNI